MRILMMTWEYPPYIAGGLGAHTGALAPALAALGIETHVVTPLHVDSPPEESHDGLTVHRIASAVPGAAYSTLYEQALRVNLDLGRACSRLVREEGGFDLLHNHDWLTSFAARELKHAHHIPLVATIHATERGRGRGSLTSPESRRINDAEWHLVYEAWRVICCTQYMSEEVRACFQTPADKIDVIPNGIDPHRFAHLEGADLSDFRRRWAQPHEKIVLSVGRVVYEKGAHVLVEAAPMVLDQVPEAKFIIAGTGPELEHLRQRVRQMSLSHKIMLPGFVDDDTRDRLYAVADCAVFPSLYEPFGIVALEAMAARTPVVVSDVGGLREVVQHAETGITIYPDNPESCAWGILHTLQHPEWAAQRVENAYRTLLEHFSWNTIARQTAAVYERVVAERASTDW